MTEQGALSELMAAVLYLPSLEGDGGVKGFFFLASVTLSTIVSSSADMAKVRIDPKMQLDDWTFSKFYQRNGGNVEPAVPNKPRTLYIPHCRTFQPDDGSKLAKHLWPNRSACRGFWFYCHYSFCCPSLDPIIYIIICLPYSPKKGRRQVSGWLRLPRESLDPWCRLLRVLTVKK